MLVWICLLYKCSCEPELLTMNVPGEHDLKTASGYEQAIPIAEIILHPSYNPNNYDNDLALVKLSRKAALNDRVRTACLPDQTANFTAGEKCYIAGWGLLEAYGRGPKVKSKIKYVFSSSAAKIIIWKEELSYIYYSNITLKIKFVT